MSRLPFDLCFLALLAAAALCCLAAAAEPPGPGEPSGEQVRREVQRLIGELDSDRFYVRQEAAERLKQMALRPELGALLAGEFQKVLLRADTSLEVRKRLEELGRGLPKAPTPPAEEVPAEEIDRLVAQLEGDRYGERLGAAKRLQWLCGSATMARRVMLAVKQRLADQRLSADALQWMEPVYAEARGVWAASDPAQWNLPPVSAGQLAAWVDEVARPLSGGARPSANPRQRIAERELWEVLVRDEYVAPLREAIQSRLAEPGLDPQATSRLQAILDMTRPAMVAEFWEGRHHGGVQRLLIGIPDQRPGAPAPSLFDRIDDQVAHCVSGVNLSPGDYPVGVAIPHPRNRTGAFFHLVNLPTPRRRMAYEHFVATDEAARLAEISRRTLDRWLGEKRSLSEHELLTLGHLDAKQVSRFASRYLLLVDDRPLEMAEPAFSLPLPPAPGDDSAWRESLSERIGGRPSRHGMLCALLATDGTKEAVPGLLEAIARGRLLPPTPEGPYQLPWIAALAIAVRDPWPDVDRWLAGLLERRDPLVEGEPEPAELGATAAAALVKRHQLDPGGFGLEAASTPFLLDHGVAGWRFSTEQARRKVEQWWMAEGSRLKQDG